MPNIIKQADIQNFLNNPTGLKKKNIGLFKTLTVLKQRNIITQQGTINREGNKLMFPNRYADEEKLFFIFATITMTLFFMGKIAL